MEDRPTAVVYHRISQSAFGDEDAGIRRQIDDTARMAENRGLAVVASFTDSDETAWAGSAKRRKGHQRPGMAAMEAFIATERPAYVVAWKDDRLFRDVARRLAFNELCRAAGTRILTYDGEMDPAISDHRLVSVVKTAVAEKASDDTQQRTARAMAENAAMGKPPGGPPPFGYRSARTADERGRVLEKRFEVDETEATAIRAGVKALLAGRSLHGIARQWNEAGLTTASGLKGRWNATAVAKILSHPRYAGLRVHQGAVIGPASWAPIVSEADHRAVVALLESRKGSRKSVPRHLLSGILRCGKCPDATPMSAAYNPRPYRGDRYRVYGCARCNGVRIKAEAVERVLVADLLNHIDSEAFAAACATASDIDVTAELDVIAECQREAAQLATEARKGTVRLGFLLAAQEGIEDRERAARRRLDELAAASPRAALAGQGARLARRWKRAGMDERRVVLEAVYPYGIAVGPAVLGPKAASDDAIRKRLHPHPPPSVQGQAAAPR